MRTISTQRLQARVRRSFDNVRTMATAYKQIRRGVPRAFSLNVAEHCPVGCDCYWKRARAPEAIQILKQQHQEVPERLKQRLAIGPRDLRPIMTPTEMELFVKARIQEGATHASFVGGEPYANVAALKRITPLICNLIGTSATLPLRNFLSTHFISVDGATAAMHDRVRRSKGLYDRILRHVGKARQQFDVFPAFVHFVANAINYKDLEGVLETWSKNGLVDGVFVSTATKIGTQESWMQLTPQQQAEVVEDMLRLKRKYGDFFCATDGMIKSFHPDEMKRQSPHNCAQAMLIPSYDGWGNRIGQCILGPDADCSTCGCVASALTRPGADLMKKGYTNLDGVRTLAVLYRLSSRQVPEPDPTGEYPPAK